jgi:hypothetical protein
MARDRGRDEPVLYDLSPSDRRDDIVMPMTKLGRTPGRPGGVLAVLGLFLVVALALPFIQPRAVPLIGAATARPTPREAPSPRPSADPARAFCYEPSGWRVTAVFMWGDRRVQSWQLMESVVASGPLDPAITFAPFISSRVMSLGWCAPSVGEQPDRPLTVAAWRVGRTAQPIRLADARVGAASARLGGLYAAPAGRTDWAGGHYVFQLSGDGLELWFGAELVHFEASASPVPSGSASPPAG